MKKLLYSLLASAFISLSLIGGITYASDDATSTLTDTETQVEPQTQEVVLLETQPETQPEMQPTQNSEESQSESQEEQVSTEQQTTEESSRKTVECLTTTGTTWAEAPLPAATWSLDLWIRKGSSINGTTTGNVGDTVNYAITYGNGGSVVATWVTITESFPAWLVTTGALAGRTQLAGSGSFTYTIGTLNPGDSGQILFVGTALTGDQSWFVVTNTATITSDTFEDAILLWNNTASTSVVVFATWVAWTGAAGTWATGWVADLYVVKTSSIATGNVGDTFVYTLTYGNSGNALATGITLTEKFPVSVSGDMTWWTNLWANIRQMTLPDLAAWSVWSVSITGSLIQWAIFGANVINIAWIETASAETSTGNNTTTVELLSFTWSNNCNCNGRNSLKGVVYQDTLRNNVYNAGTDGTFTSVTVNLYKSGSLIATTQTVAWGEYAFNALPDGTYDVWYVVPSGAYIAIVSNVGDKWGVSTSVLRLSTIILTWGVTSLSNNFGLISEWGSGWWGGGGFGWGVNGDTPPTPTIPTPTTPVEPKDPVLPLGPSESQEYPLLPAELLWTWPEAIAGTLVEVTTDTLTTLSETVTAKATATRTATEAFVQTIPTVLNTQSTIRPIHYSNITAWYETALSRFTSFVMYLLFGSMLAALSVYIIQSRRS